MIEYLIYYLMKIIKVEQQHFVMMIINFDYIGEEVDISGIEKKYIYMIKII